MGIRGKLLFDESKCDGWMTLAEMEDSPYQRNTHDEDQIKSLAKVMREEGITHPIFITRGTHRIAFGHGRRDAAILNEWTEFPIVYIDFDSEEKEYRMVQSDNALGQWSILDIDQIKSDMDSREAFDFELLGIKDFSLESIETIKEKEIDENLETKHECPSCGYVWG